MRTEGGEEFAGMRVEKGGEVLVSDVPARLDRGAWENCNLKAEQT